MKKPRFEFIRNLRKNAKSFLLKNVNKANQGEDNEFYPERLERRRLMSFQQFISKPKNFIIFYIGAFFICSFLILILVSTIENMKIEMFPFRVNTHISIFRSLFRHMLFFFILMPILEFILFFYFRYKVGVAFGNLNVGQKGTGRWATREEIDEQYKKIADKIERFEGVGGLPVARDKNMLYIDQDNTHSLVIGTTRSGKGEIIVNPLAEILSRASEQSSMILTDPKLELAFMQIPELEKRGYDCYILNLIDPEFSCFYNILELMIKEYIFEKENKNNDTSNTQQYCESLGYSMFVENENDPQPFFNNAARDLFMGTIYACLEDAYNLDEKENQLRKVVFEDKERLNEIEYAKRKYGQNHKRYFLCKIIDRIIEQDGLDCDEIDYEIPNKLSYLLTRLEEENIQSTFDSIVEEPSKNTMTEIMDFYYKEYMIKVNGKYVNQYEKKEFEKTFNHIKKVNVNSVISIVNALNNADKLDDYFITRSPDNYAKLKYATVQSGGKNAKGDVISTFFQNISLFIPTNMKRLISKSSFDIMDIGFGEKPVALYIGLPDYDDSKNFLASIVIDQIYNTLAKLASAMPDKKVPRRVHFILDEFTNVPQINNMATKIKVGAGRNLIFNLIVQDIASLNEKYGESANSIISNCGNKVFIKAGDNETNKEFSELLGNETIIDVHRSGRFFSLNKERTEMASERPLIEPRELKELKMGETIVDRSMKRLDKKKKAVLSCPIGNLGKYKMKLRYEYMPEVFNDKQVLYKSKNIEQIIAYSDKYHAEDFAINSEYTPIRTDNVDLNKISFHPNAILDWLYKQGEFIDFAESDENNVQSLVLNLPKEKLKDEYKREIQKIIFTSTEEADTKKNLLGKAKMENNIVTYGSLLDYCFDRLNNSVDCKENKMIYVKAILEMQKSKFYSLYNTVLKGNNDMINSNNDYSYKEVENWSEIYEDI